MEEEFDLVDLLRKEGYIVSEGAEETKKLINKISGEIFLRGNSSRANGPRPPTTDFHGKAYL